MDTTTKIDVTLAGKTFAGIQVYPDSMVSPGSWHCYLPRGGRTALARAGARIPRGASIRLAVRLSADDVRVDRTYGEFFGWLCNVPGIMTISRAAAGSSGSPSSSGDGSPAGAGQTVRA